MEKKKRKKKSMSSQIKSLKEKNNELRSWGERGWSNWRKASNKLEEIEKFFPQKYFKVKFKIKANSGFMVESEEVSESFTLNLAISNIKKNKTHPDTFELLDVKILN